MRAGRCGARQESQGDRGREAAAKPRPLGRPPRPLREMGEAQRHRAVAKATAKQVCEAAVAGWRWRKRVRAKLADHDQALQVVLTYRAVFEQVEADQDHGNRSQQLRPGHQPAPGRCTCSRPRRAEAAGAPMSNRRAGASTGFCPDATEERDPEAASRSPCSAAMVQGARPRRHRRRRAPTVATSPHRRPRSACRPYSGIKELRQHSWQRDGAKGAIQEVAGPGNLAFREHRKEKERRAARTRRTGSRRAGRREQGRRRKEANCGTAAARSAANKAAPRAGKPDDRKGQASPAPKHISRCAPV